MRIERKIILPHEILDIERERADGARYIVKAAVSHNPLYSGMIIGPSFSQPPYEIVPVRAMKPKFLSTIKEGEEGVLVHASYRENKIESLKVNWREAIQIFYTNPVSLNVGRIKTATLEEIFDIIKLKKVDERK